MAHPACSNWFSSSVVRRLGDGKATLFWSHRWIGDVSLQDRFPRLFSVARNKLASVAEVGEYGGGRWLCR